MSPYLSPCKEALLKVEYAGTNNDDLYHLPIDQSPPLNITFNETHISMKTKHADFDECEGLQYELQSHVPVTNIYKLVAHFSTPTIEAEKYFGMNCRAR